VRIRTPGRGALAHGLAAPRGSLAAAAR
jgi:hypothetical protein